MITNMICHLPIIGGAIYRIRTLGRVFALAFLYVKSYSVDHSCCSIMSKLTCAFM